MTGHVTKRATHWRVVLEVGEQAALRCPKCRRRHWSDDAKPSTCTPDHGEPEEVVARRQEMLAGKYATKKDAQQALRDALHEREHGDYVAPVDLTVGEYLKDKWLPSLGAEELSPNTLLAYGLHVKRINAHIGRIPLQKLSRSDVSVMAAKLASEKGARGSVLSPASRRAILVVLHHGLGDAVAAGLLRTNPAHGVPRPKVRMPELHTWSRDELATFLQATKDDRLSPLWRLLAMTGLRRGEALGLRWSDVDLAAGRLSIQRQRVTTDYEVMERPTKTDRGRSVAIDAATVSALRDQSQRQLDDADEWGEAWVGDDHVFTREDGQAWHPDRITDLFRQAVKAAGVPHIRLHDLRHGWATLALGAGIHPKVVQERLGHANIAMTMDRYSHVIPALQESAAELVASIVDGAGGTS